MGRDGWIGLGLLVFSGWLYSSLRNIPSNPLVPLGPDFYPRFLLLLIIVLSLALMIQDAWPGQRDEKRNYRGPNFFIKKYRPTLLCFLSFTAYILLLPVLGFLLSTILFVSVLQWILGGAALRRLPVSVIVGVGTAVIIFLVFEVYLRVFFPRGIWHP